MKKLFAFMLCAAMAATMTLGMTACNKGGGKKTLIVYTEAGFAPWEFRSEEHTSELQSRT